jgi:hypothetical protein
MVNPAPRSLLARVAGPLSRFWANSQWPSQAELDSAFMAVGLDALTIQGNKQKRVQQALMSVDDQTAVNLTEELLDLLRAGGYLTDSRYGDPS